MATVRWIGLAPLVAQVDTFTPGGTIEADDIFILTVTGADNSTCVISAAAGGTGASDVVTALKTAWNASTNVLCTGITASGTDTLILTADVAGVGFSVVGTTTEANGDAADAQTFTRAATTANSGPKDWSCAANWSGGAVPGASASEDVYVEDAEILYGLDQSGTAETLASLNINRSQIGTNPATGSLPKYLQVKTSVLNIGKNLGSGTSQEDAPVNIDCGSIASVVNVYNSTTNSTATIPAIRLKLNSSSAVANLYKGTIGIGFGDGETTTIGTINIGYISNQDGDVKVYVGSGVTVTTINKIGSEAHINCGATTITNSSGYLYIEGSGAITTLDCTGGTVYPNSSGTITTCNSTGEAIVDFSKSSTARTVTTLKVGSGGEVIYNADVLTITNKIDRYETNGNLTVTASN